MKSRKPPIQMEKDDIVYAGSSSFKILEEIGGGANYAFKAKDLNNNKIVFLKFYDTPKVKSKKYPNFRKAQEKIYERLSEGNLSDMTEQLIEHFEYDGIYYGCVKEFMTGKDLDYITRNELASIPLESRLGLAIVFYSILKELHKNGIVHTDLKPEQIFCEKKPEIILKWKLKIVDFDNAIIDGWYWDGDNYARTLKWASPEHIWGKIVDEKSDIFTSALILGRLLTGGYIYDPKGTPITEDLYENLVKNKSFNKKVFDYIENYYKKGNELVDIIKRSLSLNKENRPQIDEILSVLRSAKDAEEKHEKKEKKPTSKPSEKKEMSFVKLVGENNQPYIVYKDEVLGRKLFRNFFKTKEYQKISREQFKIFKDKSDGKWYLEHLGKHETLVNGKPVSGKVEIKKGDIIKVQDVELKIE